MCVGVGRGAFSRKDWPAGAFEAIHGSSEPSMPAAVAAETETAGAGAGAGGAGAGGGGLVKNDIAIEFVPEARLDHFGNKPGALGAKNAFFFFKSVFLCLSRACLGTMMAF